MSCRLPSWSQFWVSGTAPRRQLIMTDGIHFWEFHGVSRLSGSYLRFTVDELETTGTCEQFKPWIEMLSPHQPRNFRDAESVETCLHTSLHPIPANLKEPVWTRLNTWGCRTFVAYGHGYCVALWLVARFAIVAKHVQILLNPCNVWKFHYSARADHFFEENERVLRQYNIFFKKLWFSPPCAQAS